jgi:PAS domain S-box-containing protein
MSGGVDGHEPALSDLERLGANLPDLVFRLDREMRFLYVSPVVEAWTGILPTNLVGKDCRSMGLEPKARALIEGAARSALTGGKPVVARFGDRGRKYRSRLVPERDATGQVISLLGITEDVSDEPGAELDREAWFRSIVEVIPHMVWVARPDGANEFNNKQLEDYAGVSGETLLGDGWVQVIHPEDRAGAISTWADAQATGKPFTLPVRVRGHTGAYRWFLARAAPLRDEGGRIVRWVGTWSDIHERVVAEMALKESEHLYRAIGESIDYGVWVCAPDGRNTYASESFLKLVGMTQEQCSQFGWGDALHPDDAERTIAAWKECVRTGGKWDIEHRFRGVDGKWHPILARGVPVRGDSGEILCWAGINLDISKLKAAEEALVAADRGKDEFLALLSHELRNPLAAIQNAYNVLERGGGVGEPARRARDAIGRQARQLGRLVDDLLEVIHLSRGKVRLRLARVDLARLVRQTVEDHRPLFSNLEIGLELHEPNGSLFVDGDPARLAQVVGNLLQNASKFTDPGGHVVVEVKGEGELASVSVRDDGVGISPDMLGLIFSPFTQADRTLDRSRGGLGLGLSLVKGIALLHGGTVEVRSEGEGKGTEFVVRLPLTTESPSERPDVGEGRRAADHKRILIIEDNEDAASTLRDLLEIEGHDVFVARNGREGLEAAVSSSPDVILCDLGIPLIDGYEIARRLRAQGSRIRLVAVSGYAAAEDIQRARHAGFDAHLAKPPDPDDLLAAIAEAGEPR